MNLEIPEELNPMLRAFTVEVLKDRPPNLYQFAFEYFTRIQASRRSQSASGGAAGDGPMSVIIDDEGRL